MPQSSIQLAIHSIADGPRHILRCNKRAEPEPEPVQQTSWILRFPPEILLLIADILPPPDIAALAVSCKTLYLTMGEKSALKFSFISDQVDFLQRIEQHFPKHLVCYNCGKFHSRKKVRRKRFRRSPCYMKNLTFDYGRFSASLRSFRLPFVQVQEAVNRYRYDEGEWTKSLKSLPFSRKSGHSWSSFYAYTHIVPHIIRNRFMLSISIGLSVEDYGRTWEGLGALVREFFQFCYARPECLSQDVELDKTYLFRCPQCPCMLQVTFCRDTKWTRLNAIVYMLYNLGAGRSPFDASWMKSAASPHHDKPILENVSPANGLVSRSDIPAIVKADIPTELQASLMGKPERT